MVIKGVPSTPERPSFKTWEERAVPCVVFELTSEKTRDEDQGPKKELYQQLGVREYFLFDPLGEYLERPLIGYRLISGEYEELPPDASGGVVSSELMLRLIPDGERLRLLDYRTQQPLITPPEAYDRLHAALREIEELRDRAEKAEQERRLAQEEQQRAALAAQELIRREEEARNRAEVARKKAEDERSREEEARKKAEDERSREEEARKKAEDEHRLAVAEAEKHRRRVAELEAELARLRSGPAPDTTGEPPNPG
jgi:hypothetical protein